ncbi:ATP-binding protein [Streptomyces sp. t39]|uniref:ATP-binding protein n=1 Tax=Streptomyces sp. t39 TaxID=1828156 RepID=UPI0011CDBA4B|nr:LuxR family transcriptional regulator [Streptomyces sp. t39]TXS44651.1 helix-turn-helix transcriptional regulator [Streptomyces sp. t39]
MPGDGRDGRPDGFAGSGPGRDGRPDVLAGSGPGRDGRSDVLAGSRDGRDGRPGTRAGSGAGLAGRSAELAAVTGLLDAVRSGAGRALVMRGEPGVGKSALLRHAAGRAAPARVLRATGAEPETGLAFAALHQLLRPVAALADALPDPQRDAVRGALGLAAPPTASDRFLVAAGVLSLLEEAGRPHGLLCVVDDFHWVDRASADALLFAARRLDGDAVGLLIATRDTPDTRHTLRDLPQQALTGLDAEAAATALASWTGTRPSPRVAGRVTEATGGNPLALRETAALLTDGQLAGRDPLPDPLPLGDRIAAAYESRLAALPAATRRMLLVAALDGRGDPRVILAAAAGLGAQEHALEPAEAAGLIEAGPAAIAFRHPLVRSAVHAAASPPERRAAHEALAAAHGEAGEADRRAAHLAAAAVGPDETIAAALSAAADRARARGGHADAADVLTRAAQLTPDPAARARRLTDAATAAWLGGRPGQAHSALAAAHELAADPALLAELAQLRGRFALNAGDAADALRIFLDAADRAPGRLALLADAAEAAACVGDTDATVRIGRRVDALPAGPSDQPADVFLRAVLAGCGALEDGDRDRGVPLLRSALAAVPDTADDAAALLWAAAAASLLGESDAAAGYGARAGAVARMSSLAGTLPVVLENAATAERMNSRFALSAALSTEGLALAGEAGLTNSAAAHLANLAVCAAVRGQEDLCRAHAQDALAIAIPHRLGLRAGVASYALGLLDLGLGRFDRAHRRLTALADAGPGAGSPVVAWGSAADRVEAAAAAGDGPAARTALAFLERWSAHAASGRERARLARCRALVSVDDDEAVTLLEEALAHLSGDPGADWDRARSALLLGERLRRARRIGEARDHLREAVESFRRLDAGPWEQRARGELRAAGESADPTGPHALAALTPQELRIARLVADGASNKDVAARLFLSPRTVEYHLYKVYPKLGISSRADLVRLLDRGH